MSYEVPKMSRRLTRRRIAVYKGSALNMMFQRHHYWPAMFSIALPVWVHSAFKTKIPQNKDKTGALLWEQLTIRDQD